MMHSYRKVKQHTLSDSELYQFQNKFIQVIFQDVYSICWFLSFLVNEHVINLPVTFNCPVRTQIDLVNLLGTLRSFTVYYKIQYFPWIRFNSH